jgi:hypothetical protein
MTFEDLSSLASNGHLLPTDLVRGGADAPWRPVSEIPSLTPQQPFASLEAEVIGPASVSPQPKRLAVAAVAASIAAVVTTGTCWFLFSGRSNEVALAPAVATDQSPPINPPAPPVDPQARQQPPNDQSPVPTDNAEPDMDEADDGEDPEIDPDEPRHEPDQPEAEPVPADDMDIEAADPEDANMQVLNEPKAITRPQRGEPNDVISRPGTPEKITRQEIPSAGQASAPIEERLNRLKIIYGRRAEILA